MQDVAQRFEMPAGGRVGDGPADSFPDLLRVGTTYLTFLGAGGICLVNQDTIRRFMSGK